LAESTGRARLGSGWTRDPEENVSRRSISPERKSERVGGATCSIQKRMRNLCVRAASGRITPTVPGKPLDHVIVFCFVRGRNVDVSARSARHKNSNQELDVTALTFQETHVSDRCLSNCIRPMQGFTNTGWLVGLVWWSMGFFPDGCV
jgi:hypothetical protein